MNKWQIICPVVAIAIVTAVFAVISGQTHHRAYVYAQTRMIGQELVNTTNSPRLAQIGPALRGWLPEFLASPSGVADVLKGDEPSWLGDGTACSRLVLSNAAGARLFIRLRQDPVPESFHVLGYWTVNPQNGPANGSQPVRSGTKSPAISGSAPR